MKIRVKHLTRYVYDEAAELGPHTVRLRPATHARAQLLAYNLGVRPHCEEQWQHDPWGNRIVRLTFDRELRAETVDLIVDAAFDVRPVNPFDFYVDDRCARIPFDYPDDLASELSTLREPSDCGPLTREFVKSVPREGYVVDYLVELNRRVAEAVRYVIRNDPGVQSAEETLSVGSGSCRDSAVLLMEVLRAHGMAARFVSGYLVQLADEGIIPDQAKGVASDVVDLHAWAEVFIPGAGWIGLDGTSGLLCGEGHIPLAAAPRPEFAAPVAGTASQSARLEFELSVERLGNEVSPRQPYSDSAWRAILEAGDAIDARLVANGLELTCGGEPTFTSRLHPDLPEWITEAVGETKWQQGLTLAEQLRARLGDGSAALVRMGKLYPGESLPRWAVDLMWRRDGVPVWRGAKPPALSDPPADAAKAGADHTAALADARAVVDAVAATLGLDEASPVEAFEDPDEVAALEARLPVGVDATEADAEDPEDRRRLARILARGVDAPVGYVLPLQHQPQQVRWRSGSWQFRRGRLFLVPGDSPVGLRLPLDQLDGEADALWPVDTTDVREPFAFDPAQPVPNPRAQRRRARTEVVAEGQGRAVAQQLAAGAVRTALCVEPRDGLLHVFLPPVADADAFLELVAAVQSSAARLECGIRLEGYAPPSDPRMRSCVVTPDPGVIEVNLPVCSGLREYVEMVELVADAANHSGLCMEKYQLDGRAVGSGGGNHLTLGGPTPARSPFLVRPDLVAGVLRFLQNHPALSYLFTGLFVGPTSQAPRVDEARSDSLYELEIALAQIPAAGEAVFPWEVDRILRNLLTDVSGNTHRTEVCIDKLYDPGSLAGRQGILEFRAFEMPPHERMAAVQMLLLRAIVAMVAQHPYEHELVRWGTALHDRLMLPHFLWGDMTDVVEELSRAGVSIEAEWFRPFLELRCPLAGVLDVDDVHVEVRSALEPWPTLGEQPSGPVVSRYVDSSVERLEISVSGLYGDRYAIGVNGLRLPLHPTGRSGQAVAGVRFRAWQPPFCLHPSIGVHHPVRIDVVDTWARRSLGACAYHVWHPEGRAYEDPPLTAFEAAARRAQRFTTEGHLPWPVELGEAVPHPEQPYTLDLRRYPSAATDAADGDQT